MYSHLATLEFDRAVSQLRYLTSFFNLESLCRWKEINDSETLKSKKTKIQIYV